MNVRTLCLSILQNGEASGYEIRKLCTEGECSYFVEASYGSIYPALARMEADGLVTSRVEHQKGKPSKKVYAITEAGRAAFVAALHEDLQPDAYRSPFLLFARFAHLLPASLVERRLNEQLATLDREIAELRELGPQYGHENDRWVIEHGLACLESARAHIAENMDALLATALPDARKAAE